MPAVAEERALSASPLSAPAPADAPRGTRIDWTRWLRRRRRAIAGMAAAAALGAALGTPAGNEALASLVDRFRMEELTVVERQEAKALFDSVGASAETMNRYGEFSHVADGEAARYSTVEQLEERFKDGGGSGSELLLPSFLRNEDPRKLTIVVSPSRTIEMKVKVDGVNETMRKLGAEKLLPASIDGKRVTMTLGSAVSIDVKSDGGARTYALTQRPVPTVSVEDGVPIVEAMEAVLQFPLLPTQLKRELQQSQALDGGSAPLPIVAPDGYERMRIAKTDVLTTEPDSADGRHAAIWVSNGRLLTFDGTFEDRDDFLTLLTELIES
ncbi:hypothetical protein MO973_26515 [Paenibacillus sp. TRM 82003]|nr:hypothetical protein [Paenibacillus sp. TRM 82003]